eukprot:353778-Chlamydomonas_euryale.AAC.9
MRLSAKCAHPGIFAASFCRVCTAGLFPLRLFAECVQPGPRIDCGGNDQDLVHSHGSAVQESLLHPN